MLTPYRLEIAVLACLFLLSGCSMMHPLKRAVGIAPSLDLQVHITPDANADSVIPFDIVAVSDKKDVDKIDQMDAEAWFGAKGRCNFRGGPKANVQFHSWEFVPGQSSHIHLVLKKQPRVIYGFALYSSEGKHRVDLLGASVLSLDMGQEGILVHTENSSPQKHLASAPERTKVCPDD